MLEAAKDGADSGGGFGGSPAPPGAQIPSHVRDFLASEPDNLQRLGARASLEEDDRPAARGGPHIVDSPSALAVTAAANKQRMRVLVGKRPTGAALFRFAEER